ncbi:antibiotic biosynthesis monooxygenase family protein [Paenibacillus protaetiae]|uniref:Antibiotic biosynthesis monooxygenase n=1 Tax=Paenibacillus protaetiae TaxID=2509456 RepID=A0A4P6ERT5_9BACL|nr:antibiotic biosynthesis monooxygenase [Paenibacillus protaetiae]QAY65780.1 antibiotic biosynthesis monooxygenase [Paenibacillus protaetiae]
MSIARTPEPPYYAVIFTSQLSEGDHIGYEAMGDKMVELAAEQEGFLGVESTRGTDGLGITVSYWASLEAIQAWKNHALHRVAQEKGKSTWYNQFGLRVAKVERENFMGL